MSGTAAAIPGAPAGVRRVREAPLPDFPLWVHPEWQERFADKIVAGIKAADSGEFASEADIERIRTKYRDA